MKNFSRLLILFFSLFEINSFCQETENPAFSVMFYNTENTFDTFDDPQTDDSEFLPNGKRHWTKEKYNDKLNKISKVILSVGINPPSLVGFAEIENYKVLKDLTSLSSLTKFNYSIIHYESSDPRGIDVAAIYRPDQLTILNTKAIPITFPFNEKQRTRDILYITGLSNSKDTLHFFINHWPSRRGGKKGSDIKRKYVASVLRKQIEAILNQSPQAKIIIMGDFNDEPDDLSIIELVNNASLSNSNKIVNLSQDWLKNTGFIGTHYFKGSWSVLDQVLVTSKLLERKGLYCTHTSANILNVKFLLQEDKRFGGKAPFRTYTGFKYTGGFSDHLPVILNLYN